VDLECFIEVCCFGVVSWGAAPQRAVITDDEATIEREGERKKERLENKNEIKT
jgi:hypothetical protein